jgi:hypothetical protein
MSFPYVRRMTQQELDGRKADWGRPIVHGTLAVARYPTKLKAVVDRGDPPKKVPDLLPYPLRAANRRRDAQGECIRCGEGVQTHPAPRVLWWKLPYWARFFPTLCSRCYNAAQAAERTGPMEARLLEAVQRVFAVILKEQA